MKKRYFVCFFIVCLVSSCNKNQENTDFPILRFDTDFYRYITAELPADSLQKYNPFLSDYTEKVIDDFSDSTLMQIYRDEQKIFADLSGLQKDISFGMKILLQNFLNLKQPEIYLHVSGWNYRVVTGENYVSLSADYYLGADYPLYQSYFYEYQLPQMTPERMAPDLFLGYLMSEFPFRGNESVLLDKMLYEGKLRYIISKLLPKRKNWEYVAYTQEQYNWCKDNESQIWKTILERQQLFTSDYLTTAQYFRDAPYTTSMPVESPAKLGIWIGFQIITNYMKQHPKTTWIELMNQEDYLLILRESKYRG